MSLTAAELEQDYNLYSKDLNVRGAHGVPGYTLLPSEKRGDAEDVLARLKKAGANEVVTMRVVGADKRPAYNLIPGAASNESETPGTGNLPATVAEQQQFDTLVSVETSVYSLDRDELLWSSTSRTTNRAAAPLSRRTAVEATSR